MINRAKQSGVALLAFMLIIVTGASYLLVKKFNANAEVAKREQQTHAALMQAKEALIAYAVNYPEINDKPERGPGYLPCPDQGANPMPDPLPSTYDESLIDGQKEGNCSANSESGTTLGLLPYGDIGLTDIRDASGERLWYAVSHNFKHHQNINYVLNSETVGSITVDGESDIAAVIIAPGPPLGNQISRRGSEEYNALTAITPRINIVADQYLESDNRIFGDGDEFYTYGHGLDSQDFNDHVVVITRQELMQAVERRVINQARRTLAEYYQNNGRYPWLVNPGDPDPLDLISDPKADSRWIWGTAGREPLEPRKELFDGTVDFEMAGINERDGVNPGDTVWNLEDGSWGTVESVDSNSITLTDPGLAFGINNSFAEGDRYLIDATGIFTQMRGSASAGSTGLTLVDTSKDFEEMGVVAGDVVDNYKTAGGERISGGMIVAIDGDRITVASMSLLTDSYDGDINFEAGDQYRIRSNTGMVTSAVSDFEFEDSATDFSSLGVEPGHTIRNMTDGSAGRIINVDTNNITVERLNGGSINRFAVDDIYSISRFSPIDPGLTGATIRPTKGFLPIYQPGEGLIPDSVTVDWSLAETDGNTIASQYQAEIESYSNEHSSYRPALEAWAQMSDGYSNSMLITPDDGDNQAACRWIHKNIMDCSLRHVYYMDSTITGSDTNSMTDTAMNFPRLGAKRGDRVRNLPPDANQIATVSGTSGANQLGIRNIQGAPAFDNSSGQGYEIEIATQYTDGTADWPTAENIFRLYDFSGNLAAASVGDVIENTRWNAIGVVTNVGSSGTYVDFSVLQGGTYPDYIPGETYRIHHAYIDKREYTFNLKILAVMVTGSEDGIRDFRICNADSASEDCPEGSVLPSVKDIFGDNVTSIVTIRDLDEEDNVIADVMISSPETGAQGSIRLSEFRVPYKFIPGVDIPVWFLNNRWHQYLYAAYSDGYAPDQVTPACGGGGEPACISVDVRHPSDGSVSGNPDNQSIVLGIGRQLANQNRAQPLIENYMEHENANLINDLLFEKRFMSANFNDQIRVICPDPYYPAPGSLICAP